MQTQVYLIKSKTRNRWVIMFVNEGLFHVSNASPDSSEIEYAMTFETEEHAAGYCTKYQDWEIL